MRRIKKPGRPSASKLGTTVLREQLCTSSSKVSRTFKRKKMSSADQIERYIYDHP